MRDDIHRRLPLPPAWKRVVKACARDAETALRPSVLAEAVRTELRHLRPSVVMLVRRALAARQQFLFPAGSFERAPAPATPIAKCPSSIHDALALGAEQAVRGRVAHEWRALIDTLPAGSWARALPARQENG